MIKRAKAEDAEIKVMLQEGYLDYGKYSYQRSRN